jgi:hypothetical protein
MIHELRIYAIAPGKLPEYLEKSFAIGRKARGDNFGKQEGYWTTEFGPLNRVVHLWSYADLNERTRLRAELGKYEPWTKGYLPEVMHLVLTQETQFLTPIRPLKAPTGKGNVYELRQYRCRAGKSGEFAELIRQYYPAREKYSINCGAWTTETGGLNGIAHLWAYPDLNARFAARKAAAQDKDWQAFLAQAVPLLADMHAMVLLPTHWSALQ